MEAGRSGLSLSRAFLALVTACALAILLLPPPATAASPSVNVLQSVARSDFPRQLTFQVVAQSTAQIASVRLAYRIGDDPITVEAVATLTPGVRVTATRQIDLQREYYPPGLVIHYRWLIQEMTGAGVTTSWQELPVVDPRFLWHERAQGGVVLHWYSGDNQFSDGVLASAATAFQVAENDVGGPVTSPVNVYLYATEQDFRSAIASTSNQWVGGLAYPTYREVVLFAPPTDLPGAQRSVAEEMTHIALDASVDSPYGPLPTWLDEGLAVTAEGETDPTFAQALQSAVANHSVMSIQSLSGNFPEATDQATVAYAESESLVRYFLHTYGRDKLARLIAGYRAGETSDEAFQQAISMTGADFQRDWLASLASATPAATTSTGSGLLSGPINFVAGVVRQILRIFQTPKGQQA